MIEPSLGGKWLNDLLIEINRQESNLPLENTNSYELFILGNASRSLGQCNGFFSWVFILPT